MDEIKLEWNEEQKRDFIATYELWCWLAETGKYKKNWDNYERICYLSAECAFCHYFLLFEIDEDTCFCPLNNNYECVDFDIYYCIDGLYKKWLNSDYESDNRKKYAGKIRDKIKNYLQKEGVL